jgi:predicted GH43/DUF377 family glycosyl hydrolase
LRKLQELGVEYADASSALHGLPESFLMEDLVNHVRRLRTSADEPSVRQAGERALMLARANYTVRFADGLDISEKILFPFAPSEVNGIEDARFTRFQEADGSISYTATYTAYDGNVVLPQILQTRDFHEFSIRTLNGPAIRNKGLALFPKKINGHYVMLGRQDGENIYLMESDMLHFWHSKRLILRPTYPWEYVQIGNCGSPIETPAGWLVLTHGVGPMRKYSIGAVLLDLEDPSQVIGRLRTPLLSPNENERAGYVPNVVYSCGSLLHNGLLVIPYSMSDYATTFATVPLADVLDAMEPPFDRPGGVVPSAGFS